MSQIALLATGGTIASRSTPGGRVIGAAAADLLAGIQPPSGVELGVRELMTRPSFTFCVPDLLTIARGVRDALADGSDGVVVTHGTDVMEETAFLTGLTHDDPRPVVFTGAQRPLDHPAPDGPGNLADALEVAASPAARGLGVLLAFDGLVFPAWGVTKCDTLALGAFTAPGRGPVLRVSAGRVDPIAVPVRFPATLDANLTDLPRVDVVALYAGAEPALLRAAVAADTRGVVLAAPGAGNAGSAIVEEVARLTAEGVPVVVCSRVASGPALPLYATGLTTAGAIFAGALSPWQARILLAAALAAPGDPSHVLSAWLG